MSTVTITVTCRLGNKEVEMLGVTTVHYAAKRCADAYGLDDDMFWGLARAAPLHGLLPLEDCIAQHTDIPLELVPLELKS